VFLWGKGKKFLSLQQLVRQEEEQIKR